MMQEESKNGDSAVIESNNQPDYSAVTVPTKAPTDYSYVERRAELLQLVEQSGHPKAINQSELAERYGVSQSQISKDLDRLDEFIKARISNRRDLTIRSVLDRSIRGLLNEDEYYKAAQVAKMLDDYLEGRVDTLEFRRRLDRLETMADREALR